MAADPVVCDALARQHSLDELHEAERELLQAYSSPEAVTSDTVESLGLGYKPKTQGEIRQALADIACAIKKLSPLEEQPLQSPSSRFFRHGSRRAAF